MTSRINVAMTRPRRRSASHANASQNDELDVVSVLSYALGVHYVFPLVGSSLTWRKITCSLHGIACPYIH